MSIIFFSTDMDIIDEWKENYKIQNAHSCHDFSSLMKELEKDDESILIVDYNTVSNELNRLISLGGIPQHTIVLEKEPEIVTGLMLITHGVKAYGNARMAYVHFTQILGIVEEGNIWTYPELTVALAKTVSNSVINENSKTMIENRLSPKEIEVIYLLLDGLTNNVIASKLDITTRTVKAHVSSIFSKLHVSDRISLILLLK